MRLACTPRFPPKTPLHSTSQSSSPWSASHMHLMQRASPLIAQSSSSGGALWRATHLLRPSCSTSPWKLKRRCSKAGWPPGATKQADPDCLFGQILGWFNKNEVTGRGDLHNHENMIQPDLQTDQVLQHALERPEQLAKFLGAISCRTVPDIPTADRIGRTADPKPTAYRMPLDPLPQTQQATNKFVGNTQLDVLLHHHTSTCAKNGGGANDVECRCSMPRCSVSEPSVVAQTGSIVTACNNPWVVGHAPAMIMGQPMNQAIWLSVDALRDYYIWAEAASVCPSKGKPPPMAGAHQHAAKKAEYAAKYTSKPDNVNVATPIAQLVLRISERAQAVAEARMAEAIQDPSSKAAKWSLLQHKGLSKLPQKQLLSGAPPRTIQPASCSPHPLTSKVHQNCSLLPLPLALLCSKAADRYPSQLPKIRFPLLAHPPPSDEHGVRVSKKNATY